MLQRKRSYSYCHIKYFCLVQSLCKAHCTAWCNRTSVYLLWTRISGPHSSGYTGSTSADTVMLTWPRSDARIWNRWIKVARSLTQAKIVELSFTSSTPGDSSKIIRTLNKNVTSTAGWWQCNIFVIQGGSKMTGTNCDLFTHKSSRSYLNHLV
jgi:hypothetical protein